MAARSFGLHAALYDRRHKTLEFQPSDDVLVGLPLSLNGFFAERISVKNFGQHLQQARDKMTRIALAKASGMSRRTVSHVEANTSPVPASAATLYRGLGNLGLYLAFAAKQDGRETYEQLLLANPYDQTAIKDWYRESYREAGLRRPGVCELVGVTVESLQEFMETRNSSAGTLNRYIQPVLGLRVDFCGIQAAVPENT